MRNRILTNWTLILITFLFAGCRDALGQEAYLRELAVQDIEFLSDGIKLAHPNPFMYISEAEFDSSILAEKKSLPEVIGYYEFRKIINRIVYCIHCVHSTVSPPKYRKKKVYDFFPVEVRIVNDQLFVFEKYTPSNVLSVGDEILVVNDRLVKDILKTMDELRGCDCPQNYFIRGLINQTFKFNLLYKLSYPGDTIFNIQFRTPDGILLNETLRPVHDQPVEIHSKDSLHWDFVNKSKNLSLKLDSTTAYLKIKRFRKNKHDYDDVFEMISLNNTKNLVLDLRDNGGGQMTDLLQLLRYLIDEDFLYSVHNPTHLKAFNYYDLNGMCRIFENTMYFHLVDDGLESIDSSGWRFDYLISPHKKNNFKGKLMVLINSHSLSSASVAASFLRHYSQATIVGEPSGGAEFGNSGYTYSSLTLPNSQFVITLPQNWINYRLPSQVHRCIHPDIMIRTSVDDMLQQNDLVLDTAFQLLKTGMH